MTHPLFDFDLKRISREHYITGEAAINSRTQAASPVDGITCPISTVTLAGIHYPDTTGCYAT